MWDRSALDLSLPASRVGSHTVSVVPNGRFSRPFPIPVVHVAPHVMDAGLSTKPFMDAGARPPLREFSLAHWEPQKYWVAVVGCAETSPITKAPTAAEGDGRRPRGPLPDPHHS